MFARNALYSSVCPTSTKSFSAQYFPVSRFTGELRKHGMICICFLKPPYQISEILSVSSTEQRGVVQERVIYEDQNGNSACAVTIYLFRFKMINKFASLWLSVP